MSFHVPNETHKVLIRKENGEKNLLLPRLPEEEKKKKKIRAVVFEPRKDLFLRPTNLFFPLARRVALGLSKLKKKIFIME